MRTFRWCLRYLWANKPRFWWAYRSTIRDSTALAALRDLRERYEGIEAREAALREALHEIDDEAVAALGTEEHVLASRIHAISRPSLVAYSASDEEAT